MILRVARFLGIAGCFPGWSSVALPILLLGAIAERVYAGRSETSLPVLLVLLPIAAGTGILTRAREGKLDLLLASEVRRGTIWAVAAVRALGVPLGAAAITAAALLPASDHSAAEIGATIVRVLAAGAMTASIGFAVGMLEPRYLIGILWIAIRAAFALTPQTFALLGKLAAASHGVPLEPETALLIAYALPEIVLDNRLPLWTAAVLLATAAIALLISRRSFLRAEFTGRRQD